MFLNKLKKIGLYLGTGLLAGAFATSAIAKTENLVKNPETTVVYDLAILDSMNALGINADAVPTTIWPDFLNYYEDDKKYPKVGTLFEPDYEAVFSLKPDLIMVAGRSAPKYKELSKIASTLDLTVDNAHLVDSIKKNVNTLATIYGKQDQANKQLAELDEALAKIQEKSKGVGNALLILTVGGKISAYGPGSRFGIIHDAFGVGPAVKNLEISNHGQAISLEYIFKTNPDWLFVIDRDAAIGVAANAAQQLLDNELIHKTTAWQKGQIVYLDPINWYILGNAGLNSIKNSIKEVSSALDK